MLGSTPCRSALAGRHYPARGLRAPRNRDSLIRLGNIDGPRGGTFTHKGQRRALPHHPKHSSFVLVAKPADGERATIAIRTGWCAVDRMPVDALDQMVASGNPAAPLRCVSIEANLISPRRIRGVSGSSRWLDRATLCTYEVAHYSSLQHGR
jgi:hypothetical protein